MWGMRARAVIGSILLVLMPLLAACGDEEDLPQAGDIIRARLDNQFRKARESSVTLPTGRLIIHSGQPVDRASAEETRTRQVVEAPSGTVLVPISWQYDPWRSDKLDSVFAAEDTPIVELIAGDGSYRLTPPQKESDGAESFYVVVAGDGAGRSLKISFDGVTQTVDLQTGSRDEGVAAGLYDIADEKLKKKACDHKPWFNGPTVVAEFECDFTGPVLTPYAAGRWAPVGKLWLVITVSTNMRIYGETNRLGGGARYVAGSVKVKPRIDRHKPARVLSTEDDTDICPIVSQSNCGWSKHLVFKVPNDDGQQGPLHLAISYRLNLATSWNGFSAENHKKVHAEEKFKIWR